MNEWEWTAPKSGFKLMPVTLEVGDYVLSPNMCVERKSVPDLIGSLQSGRLYNQAESMSKHYKMPILLIEFEREKAFALQSLGDMGSDISLTSLQSRLCLLVIAFPRLRIMWSRSLHATAEMFAAFKAGHVNSVSKPWTRLSISLTPRVTSNHATCYIQPRHVLHPTTFTPFKPTPRVYPATPRVYPATPRVSTSFDPYLQAASAYVCA